MALRSHSRRSGSSSFGSEQSGVDTDWESDWSVVGERRVVHVVHITFVTCVLLFFFHYYYIFRTTRTVYQKPPPIVWQVGFVNTRRQIPLHRPPPPRWTSFGRFPQCFCSKQQVRVFIVLPLLLRIAKNVVGLLWVVLSRSEHDMHVSSNWRRILIIIYVSKYRTGALWVDCSRVQ